MARAYASTIIDAPVETVWSLIRDFNGLPSWVPGITDSRIEDGLDADVVGCVRAFRLPDGTLVRERLLSLDDHRYSFSYNFETPAFPVTDYLARVTLIPVTNGDGTFAEWEATFDERPEDAGTYAAIIADGVFKAGWDALKAKVARERPGAGLDIGLDQFQRLMTLQRVHGADGPVDGGDRVIRFQEQLGVAAVAAGDIQHMTAAIDQGGETADPGIGMRGQQGLHNVAHVIRYSSRLLINRPPR